MIDLQKEIPKLPSKPGLYFFKNAKNEVIYIGKSVNLKNRVKSYFQNKKLGLWTRKMVSEIKTINYKILPSEFSALLEEAKLINSLQPHYNIQFKDDKRYLLIAVSQELYPRIFTARQREAEGIFFGPFPSSNEVRLVLKTLRRIFPFRSCIHLPKKACLYYHLHLCPGCCLGYSQKEYQKTIRKIIKFLNGNINGLISDLKKEMVRSSQKMNFEKCEELKRQIEAIKYVVLNWQSLGEDSLTIGLIPDEKAKIMAEAKKILPQVEDFKKIEAYDISNLFGHEATGSLVVFSGHQEGTGFFPAKDQYRRFKIGTTGIDDLEMMREVILRRLQNRQWPYPNLMLVDGGKNQVGAVFSVLREKNLSRKIYLLGLAKKEETIIKPIVKNKTIIAWQEIKLKKDSPFLRLLQNIRNESHRFAKKYHLLLRRKKMIK